jgi:endonuclease YncB( thermonuclease family)
MESFSHRLASYRRVRHAVTMTDARLPRRSWRARLRATGWTVLLLATLAALWLVQRPPLHEGRMAFASDGDSFTIRVDGDDRPVRLLGIDAPELAQTCQDALGKPWPCGTRARDALTVLAPRRAPIACRSEGQDRFNRALSRCTLANGRDLAALLVAQGWAIATSEDYLIEQDRARDQRTGVWQGDFLTPAEWRSASPRK